jgi:hypothetical protein
MAIWPSTLPQAFLYGTYKETDKDLVLTFKTEAGPPMTRLRCESNILPFSGDMIMTQTQKATYRAFWEANCAISFSFPDPDTGSLISVVFTDKAEYSDVAGYDDNERVWRVHLQMAKVP